jgi:uncharacterized membrane protein HdeD (DUF308 family)
MNAHAIGSRLMLRTLEKNWWLLMLRGIAAILFGLLAVAWPGITLTALVLVYGVFVLMDGVFALTAAIKGGSPAPGWWLAVAGIASIIFGALTLSWPAITALVLLLFIAGWAIASGLFQIVGAIKLRKEISNEWLLIAIGALSVLFGCYLFVRPVAGALSLAFAVGIFAIAYGALLIAFSLKLRKHDYAAHLRL